MRLGTKNHQLIDNFTFCTLVTVGYNLHITVTNLPADLMLHLSELAHHLSLGATHSLPKEGNPQFISGVSASDREELNPVTSLFAAKYYSEQSHSFVGLI